MEEDRPHGFGAVPPDVETPILAIDVDLFAASARAVAGRHAAHAIRWCPKASWAGVASVAQSLRSLEAAGVSVAGIAEAAAAVSAGFSTITVEIPPIVLGQPKHFADLCRTASLTAVCDHFAQVELIARACQEAGTDARVLLRVDVGLQRLGVRPGPDLSDLAEGVGRLRGVRLVGVWIGGSPVATGVGRLQGPELTRLFDRCHASLARAGHELSVLSVSSLDQLVGGPFAPTETRASNPAERDGVFVLAGVVARPTRNQAVIDAGREHIGSSARVAGPPGATEVVHIDDDFTVLRLTPDRQDFGIGDVVALIPASPIRPRSGETVLVASGGTWKVEYAYRSDGHERLAEM